MRFVNIAAALTAVSLTYAFIIPKGTPYGVYSVTTLQDGTEVHEKIGDFPSANTTTQHVPRTDKFLGQRSDKTLAQRSDPNIWCLCGDHMPDKETHDAVVALENQENHIIASGASFYSYGGKDGTEIVAFACNRATIGALLESGKSQNGFDDITFACGWNVAGTRGFYYDTGVLFIGYQHHRDEAYCDNYASILDHGCIDCDGC